MLVGLPWTTYHAAGCYAFVGQLFPRELDMEDVRQRQPGRLVHKLPCIVI